MSVCLCFRFPVSSEERLKVHQCAVSYLGLACYTKGSSLAVSHIIRSFQSERGNLYNKTVSCLCCESTGALSSMFYLAHEFHDDPKGGILVNTNCGGLYRSFGVF